MMSYFLFIAVAQGCNFSCIDLLKDARSLNYSGLTTGTLPPICVPGSASSALQLGAFNEQTAIAAALSNGNVNVNAMYTSNCVTSNLTCAIPVDMKLISQVVVPSNFDISLLTIVCADPNQVVFFGLKDQIVIGPDGTKVTVSGVPPNIKVEQFIFNFSNPCAGPTLLPRCNCVGELPPTAVKCTGVAMGVVPPLTLPPAPSVVRANVGSARPQSSLDWFIGTIVVAAFILIE